MKIKQFHRRVINFNYPPDDEDYIHRIGRTGRAGSTGQADTLFVTPTDAGRAPALVRILRDAGQPVDEQLAALVRKRAKKSSKASKLNAEAKAEAKATGRRRREG